MMFHSNDDLSIKNDDLSIVYDDLPVHSKHPLNETMVDVGNLHIPLGPCNGGV